MRFFPKRGTCSVCGFRHRVRASDGLIGAHFVYSGDEGRKCAGSLRPEKYALSEVLDRIEAREHKAGSGKPALSPAEEE